MSSLAALVALAAALLVFGPAALRDLQRPGYSPDEEFTLFAARSITSGGLPLLPSGLLYDRGLGYSYASWAAGALFGQSLVIYRAVSLVSSLAALVALFAGVRRIGGTGAAWLATALLAASLPFWAAASNARFYGPFLLCYLLTLLWLPQRGVAAAVGVVVAAACCRFTHELAFTLGFVPAACVVLTAAGRGNGDVSTAAAVVTAGHKGRPLLVSFAGRRRPLVLRPALPGFWIGRTVLVGLGLAAAQAVLVWVNYLAPTSGGTMVKRFFLWQVLNLMEKPPVTLPLLLPLAAGLAVLLALGLAIATAARREWAALPVVALGGLAAAIGQLGVAPLVGLCALPVAPARRHDAWRAVLAVFAAGLAFWLIALIASGRPVLAAGALVAASSFVYPTDAVRYLLGVAPLLTVGSTLVLEARASGVGGPWPREVRALHALWLGWVVWFGVIESGINARYLLVPLACMLAALALDLVALARAVPPGRRAAGWAGVAAVALAVTVESWVGVPPGASRLLGQRPTVQAQGLADEVQPDDVVACGDEMACLMLLGRADAWLTLDPFFRERFVVERDGREVGVYAAAPAHDRIAPLLAVADRRGGRLLILDVAKDVPGLGSSAPLVERALAAEGLRTRTLATGAGVRLLEVLVPEGQAGRGRAGQGRAG